MAYPACIANREFIVICDKINIKNLSASVIIPFIDICEQRIDKIHKYR